MITTKIGTDCNGDWSAHQYAIDMGWDAHCVEQTAKLGVSMVDADGLTEDEQAQLLAFCRDRFPQNKTYTVKTDGFMCDDIEADSLDEAIEIAFAGEGLGKIVDQASLEEKFEKYVADGGWCWIECDGDRVLEIGKC